MSLRIVHLASGDGWGGSERVLSVLLEGFKRRRQVLSEALLLNDGVLAGLIRSMGVPLTIIPETENDFLALAIKIRRRVALSGATIVHAHRYKEIIFAVLATIFSARRVVITVHGLDGVRGMGVWGTFVIWGALAFARLAGAQFVTVSPEIMTRLSRCFGRKHVECIGNPIPPSPSRIKSINLRRSLGWADDRQVIGFVGRLEAVKGPDLFLDIVEAASPKLGFVLIGSGSMEGVLTARIVRRSLEDRVRMLGQVPDATPYLRQLDALALTSRHEGTPVVLLESAKCHLPVVAFDVGGVAAVMRGAPASRIIPPFDVVSFLAELNRILTDRARANTASAIWANSVTSRYSLDRVLSQYLSVYSEIAVCD